MSQTQVYFWYKRFKDGRKSIADDSRSGRPLTSTTDRNIGQVRDLIVADRKNTIDNISEILGISYELTVFLWVLKEDKKQESSKMETNEIRAVIKYLCKKGMSPKEIYEGMVDTLREDAPSYSTKNDSSSDRRDLGYSKNNSGSDYERTLGPWEAFCPLGSQTFDTRSKGCKEKVYSDNLALFEANPEEFVSRFVTMDEDLGPSPITITPESKQQSMQWRTSGSLPSKKAKTVPSAGKVMVSVIWDSEGVLLLDFLNKGQTITGNYYANLVKQLREAIKEKRRGMLSRKIVYHQDNAPSLRSLQAMAAIYDSGFELLPHAPYSPDLAPSDFHLFPHLKKSLSGIHFRSDEEVIDAVNPFFESLETSFFLEGITALEHRWKKCIDLKGNYVEK
ncbi:hypothetical protein LAZ67_2001123 [Cordylochernes scorpioides]|uniref:Transposase n=1 Tax=Cordylochernes scorpioides TaxID=51811 RepID=A0ABY6K460_9ARAC|nr:hypothetical protein LAZ67_2001123 [Cordylochernes scorpioides]